MLLGGFLAVLPCKAFAQAAPDARPPVVRTTQPHTRPATPATIPSQVPGVASRDGVPKPTAELKPGEVPAISFAEPVWDFGRTKAGDDLTHDFVFTNTGTGPLEILLARPG
jgi:hypothetical protein